MICPYCGTDTSDPGGPSDGYMFESHVIMQCHKIPKLAHDWYNKPWVRSNLRHRLFMRFHRHWPFSLLFTVDADNRGGAGK